MRFPLTERLFRSSAPRRLLGVICLASSLLFCLHAAAQTTEPAAPSVADESAEVIVDAPGASESAEVAVDSPAAEGSMVIGFSLDPATWWTGAVRLVELGGVVVIVQLVVSVIGFAAVMFKVLQFMQVRSAAFRSMHKAIEEWSAGNTKQGDEILKRIRLAFARDVEHAVAQLRPDNAELVREELYRRARIFLQPLHDHLPTIEIIYYIAPLLGLLGTVTGIIASFQALEASGSANDAAQLAAGIWEALLCTGLGLSMAIPFAVIHGLLETRLNRIIANVEDVIARVFTASLDQRAA